MYKLCRPLRVYLLVLFVSIIILYTVYIFISINSFQTNLIACYRIKGESLPDITMATPSKGKSIFFHETSCNSYFHGKLKISARQACAVESAAAMNPDYEVYLLFTSPGVFKDEGNISDRFFKALLSYKNVKMYHLDYETYVKDTPVEVLYKNKMVENSKYAQSHASDVLRYLTLWKYGGIYLDLDVIVLKNLGTLKSNFAGAESERNVAAGVLSFEPDGKGHKFAQTCVEDLRDHFNGDNWGYNGPGVITRLLQKVCGVKKAKDMVKKNCQGFKVYPPETFYIVPWGHWNMFFNSKYNNDLVNRTKNSYIIHVWNKYSINTKIPVNSVVPYSLFAKKHCPKVFAECDQYF